MSLLSRLEGQSRPVLPDLETFKVPVPKISALDRDVEDIKIKAQQKLLDEWNSHSSLFKFIRKLWP